MPQYEVTLLGETLTSYDNQILLGEHMSTNAKASGTYFIFITALVLAGALAVTLYSSLGQTHGYRDTMERVVARDYPGASVVSVKTAEIADVNFDGDLKTCQIEADAVQSSEGGLPTR